MVLKGVWTENFKGKAINFAFQGIGSGEGVYIMRSHSSAFIKKEDIHEITTELSIDMAIRKVFLPKAKELGLNEFFVTDGMGSIYRVDIKTQW
tara:strand:- start:138 stop:416 length:279 start_codon:yes stop_codon:yes gene_type:complete